MNKTAMETWNGYNIINRKSIKSLDELLLYSAAVINRNIYRSNSILYLLKIDVNYSNEISNSHSAPIDGVRNWGYRHAGRPVCYPGWGGRVWAFFSKQPNSKFESEFTNSLIHRGSGGYGLYDIGHQVHGELEHPEDLPLNQSNEWAFKKKRIYPVSYDCKIFLQDLPGIRTQALLTETDLPKRYQGTYDKDNQGRISSWSD